MPKYRRNLPQLSTSSFLSDGGIETTLIFLEGIELPHFASFLLLKDEEGRARLRRYYERYIAMARERGVGFLFDGPTWRANADWGRKLGYSAEALAEVNRQSIRFMADIRAAQETPTTPIVISGCIGPRGDGYQPDRLMSAEEAQSYHSAQIEVFRDTEADMVAAFTMTNTEEAIGIARAAAAADMPVAISFTLETDGRLPTGQRLKDAIETVDRATGAYPVYYMLNCAHPTHFAGVLEQGEAWTARLRGLRANASTRSHAELDAAPDLDAGDPEELGRQYRDLRGRFRSLTILGGCCGTDYRHLERICAACLPAF